MEFKCGQYNVFEIQQGVRYVGKVYLWDESVTPNVPLDITGLTVFISVKELNDYSLNDSKALITSKITVHTDPLLGETEWILTKVETMVKLGRYKADAKIYTSDLVFLNSVTFLVDIIPIVTMRLV